MTKLNQEQITRIIESYGSGVSGPKLAEMFGVSTCAIYKILKRNGVKSRKTWAQTGERKCCKCGGVFPMSEFHGTREYWCKKCASIYRKENRNYDNYYTARYGITEDEYWDMIEAQDYKCAICHKELAQEDGRMYVDHDHKTGKVRGALCRNCNSGLGMFMDDTTIMQSAIEYIKSKS